MCLPRAFEVFAQIATQSGHTNEVIATVHWIIAGATEIVHCVKISNRKENTMLFLVLERLEC